MEDGLKGLPEWYDGNPVPWKSNKQKNYVANPPFTIFSGSTAAISIKTGDGMNNKTNVLTGDKKYMANKLPVWGRPDHMRREYL